jgi:hypothetical protein
MAAITLERVLSEAEALPADERAMLEELLHKRRVDGWRQETAAAARKSIRAYRAGKLKSQPVEDVIRQLRAAK